MQTREQILKMLQELFEELFELPPEKVTLSASLFTDLDFDSLDAIDLAATLSKRAGIKLAEEELKSIRTVADIVELGFRKLNPEA
jgi:acyl carrier protein